MNPEPSSGALRFLPAGAREALDSPVLRGVGLMFGSTFFFAAMHGSIRYVSATIHPFYIAYRERATQRSS